MDAIPVLHSSARMCHIIRLEDCRMRTRTGNPVQHVRLGPVLKWMDIAACMSAERLAKTSCVTLSMDHLIFSGEKACEGDVMIIEAKVVRAFSSSAEVVVEVFVDGSMETFAHAFFVFVRMDRGKFPQVFPQSRDEIKEFELSMERRKARKNKRTMIEAAKTELQLFSDAAAKERQLVTLGTALTSPRKSPRARLSTAPEPVPADASLLKYVQIVLPPHANHMGNTFGGQIMEWAEEAAILSAKRHLRHSSEDLEYGATFSIAKDDFVLATVYVDGVIFLKPSTVGDRLVIKTQCTRAFGPLLEVEVDVAAMSVSGDSKRHIVTGYFSVGVQRADGSDVSVADVMPVTTQQWERYDASLGRMLVAAVRLVGLPGSSNNLQPPELIFTGQQRGGRAADAVGVFSSSSLLNAHRESIWNPGSRVSIALSPQFAAETALELGLQGVRGLIQALPPASISPTEDDWELPPKKDTSGKGGPGRVLDMYVKKAGGIVKLQAKLRVRAPIEKVEELLLDLERRPLWDDILVGERLMAVSEETDLVWYGTSEKIHANFPSPTKSLIKSGKVAEAAAAEKEKEKKKAAGASPQGAGRGSQSTSPSRESQDRVGADYVMLRTRSTLSDGQRVIVLQSVSYLDDAGRDVQTPESRRQVPRIRGEVLPSGFLLTSVPRGEGEDLGKEPGKGKSSGKKTPYAEMQAASQDAKSNLSTIDVKLEEREEEVDEEKETECDTVIQYLLQGDTTTSTYFANELSGKTSWMHSSLRRLADLLESEAATLKGDPAGSMAMQQHNPECCTVQ